MFVVIREALDEWEARGDPEQPLNEIREARLALLRIEELLEARPSRAEVEKRVEWWITDLHFKPPELTTDAYWKTMASEIAEYAIPNPARES